MTNLNKNKMEKLIKQKLTERGFTKEIILNNRGLISAVIEEVKEAISVTRCCETLKDKEAISFDWLNAFEKENNLELNIINKDLSNCKLEIFEDGQWVEIPL
jgi:hypothetical protein